MTPLFLDARTLHELLPPARLASSLREALAALAAGRAAHSPRHVMKISGGALGMMAGEGAGSVGAKLVCVLPANTSLGLNPHQGIVAIFDPLTGACLALGDASEITALRTVSMSLAATEALAREESSVLTVVGSGTQAALHARALLHTRPIEELRVVARSKEKAEALLETITLPSRLRVKLFTEIEKALPGTDILCLTTAAKDPYLLARDLPAGVHVNAVGACRPGARELELDQLGPRDELSVFVESLEAVKDESEELRAMLEDGFLPHEIGNVFAGRLPGRTSDREITLFKSVGIGLSDVAALSLAYHAHCARLMVAGPGEARESRKISRKLPAAAGMQR